VAVVVALIISAVLAMVACAPMATGVARGVGSSGGPAPVANVSAKLMLFGGENHRTYLGCLTCSEYESDSLFNGYGSYGSRYSSDSIFNPYGNFGSRYSNDSPCNPYASNPPVIVDEGGNFYGQLTLNKYAPQRTTLSQWLAWIAGVCAD
jgi:hypothetical protein